MSENTYIYDDSVSTVQGSFEEEPNYLQARLKQLTAENDNYRQEVHELRRKLEASVAMQAELTEVNELLEESIAQQSANLRQKVQDIEEKYSVRSNEYEERLMEIEAELARKITESVELRELLAESRKERLTSRLSRSVEDIATPLRNQVNDLRVLLRQREETRDELLAKQQQLEKTATDLQERYYELEDILNVTKEELAAKDDILESTRCELVTCRVELDLLKVTPTGNSCKGNSIFAEVEDRRRRMLEKMATLRNNYLKLKHSHAAKEMEIGVLQAERAAMLRKWEDCNVEKIDRDAKLVDTYKARISELEKKLKDEEKKINRAQKEARQPIDTKFSYLQSLLTAKKKEVEELQLKLEDSSIQRVLQEETKHKLSKQLMYWRYKAMSSQAQLMAVKNQLETDTTSKSYVGVTNILGNVTKLNETELDIGSSNSSATTRQPVIVDDDTVTLEESIDPTEERYDCAIEIAGSVKSENIINVEENICHAVRAKRSTARMPLDTSRDEYDTVGETFGKPYDALETLIRNDNKNVECSMIVGKSTIESRETESYSTVNPRFDPTVRIKQTDNDASTSDGKDKNLKLISSTKESDVTVEKKEQVNLRIFKKFTTCANESNKENCVNIGSTADCGTGNAVEPKLKSALAKSRANSFQDSKEKETKSLRFTMDTMDRDIPALSKQENTKKKYPIIFISSKLKN